MSYVNLADTEMQTFLHIIISPSKRAFKKYKPGGLFSEFYGILDITLF